MADSIDSATSQAAEQAPAAAVNAEQLTQARSAIGQLIANLGINDLQSLHTLLTNGAGPAAPQGAAQAAPVMAAQAAQPWIGAPPPQYNTPEDLPVLTAPTCSEWFAAMDRWFTLYGVHHLTGDQPLAPGTYEVRQMIALNAMIARTVPETERHLFGADPRPFAMRWRELRFRYTEPESARLERLSTEMANFRRRSGEDISLAYRRFQRLHADVDSGLADAELLRAFAARLPGPLRELILIQANRKSVDDIITGIAQSERVRAHATSSVFPAAAAPSARATFVAAAASAPAAEHKRKRQPRCAFCKEKGHRINSCEKMKAAAPKKQAKHCESWILDSGSALHLTDNPFLLKDLSAPSGSPAVRTVGGQVLHAESKGTVVLKGLGSSVRGGRNIEIKDVHFIQGAAHNLLSICQLMQDRRLMIWGDGDEVYLFNGQEAIKGYAHRSVWRMSDQAIKPADVAKAMAERGILMPHTSAAAEPLPTTEATESNEQMAIRIHAEHNHVHNDLLRTQLIGAGREEEWKLIREHIRTLQCEACIEGRTTRHISRVEEPRAIAPLDRVHIDTMVHSTPDRDGNRYALIIADSYSGYGWAYPMALKSDAGMILRAWKIEAEAMARRKVNSIRTDNAPELTKAVNDMGVHLQRTLPYTSSQNGVAERLIRTLREKHKTLIGASCLDISFRGDAIMAATHIRNVTIDESRRCSPYQLLTGRVCSTKHLKCWGARVYMRIAPATKDSPTAIDGFLVGFDNVHHGRYLVYTPIDGAVRPTEEIKVMDDCECQYRQDKLDDNGNPVLNPRAVKLFDDQPTSSSPHDNDREDTAMEDQSSEEGGSVASTDESVDSDAPYPQMSDPDSLDEAASPSEDEPDKQQEEWPERGRSTQSPFHNSHLLLNPPASAPRSLSPGKRTRTMIAILPPTKYARMPGSFDESPVRRAAAAAESAIIEVKTPASYKEAMCDPNFGIMWRRSYDEEINALIANQTWEVVDRPTDTSILTCRVVFTPKHNADGTVQRFKSRLVVRGFMQKHGVNFHDTFAPTVRHASLRMFLAVVAAHDLECHQVDVCNAFTQAHLKEDIYMTAPPAMVLPKGKILKLRKSLYGLKQAARDWNQALTKLLTSIGFTASDSDPCLFLHKEKELILLVYVDDMAIAGPSLQNIQWFKDALAERFKIKDLGEMSRMIGVEIERNRAARSLRIHQRAYVEATLRELDANDELKSRSAPPGEHDRGLLPEPEGTSHSTSLNDEQTMQYQSLIGKLNWLANVTRVDIAYAVGRLAQFSRAPTEANMSAARATLAYVKGQPDRGITYHGESEHGRGLFGHSDSDFARDPAGRMSVLAYIFTLYGGAIDWASRKQKSVATSTAEAEYVALSTAGKEALWLQRLGREIAPDLLEHPFRIRLGCDNQAAAALSRDHKVTGKSKHIDIHYHNIRELVARNLIEVQYVPTDAMMADGLTKPLATEPFNRFTTMIGMTDGPLSTAIRS